MIKKNTEARHENQSHVSLTYEIVDEVNKLENYLAETLPSILKEIDNRLKRLEGQNMTNQADISSMADLLSQIVRVEETENQEKVPQETKVKRKPKVS